MLFVFRYCHIATRKRNWLNYQKGKVEPFCSSSYYLLRLYLYIVEYTEIYIGPSLNSNCIELPHSWEIAGRLPSFFPVELLLRFFCWRSCHTTAITSRRQRLWILLVAQTNMWCANGHVLAWVLYCFHCLQAAQRPPTLRGKKTHRWTVDRADGQGYEGSEGKSRNRDLGPD